MKALTENSATKCAGPRFRRLHVGCEMQIAQKGVPAAESRTKNPDAIVTICVTQRRILQLATPTG